MNHDVMDAELKARAFRARYLAKRRLEKAIRRKQTLFEIKRYFKTLSLKFGAIHYDAVKQHYDDELYSDYQLQPMDNGITRTSSLYYVVTKDIHTGNINIFWSRAQKYLATEVNDQGVRQFVMPEGEEENQFRYHLPVLPPNASKKDIRDAISNHHGEFRDFSWERMRLHTADFTRIMGTIKKPEEQSDPSSQNYEQREVLAFSNLDFSLSLHEYPDNKWRLKMHAPIKKRYSEKTMVDSYSLHTAKNYLNEGLTNARTIMEFDSRAEALAYKHLMANHRTQRTWRGQNTIPMKEAAFAHGTTNIYNFTIQEMNDRENVDESEFDTGVTIAGAAAVGLKVFLSIGLPKLIAGAVVSGFGMRKGVEVYKKTKAQLKWYVPNLNDVRIAVKKTRIERKLHLPKAKGIVAVDPDNGPYRINTKDNYRRPLNAKPNADAIPSLEVLDSNSKFPDGEGKDISHDDTPLLSSREKNWKQRWLMAFDAKAFGGTASGIDRQTSSDYSFNGLVRLSHRCPKTREIITYARYVEALDVNDKISIPDDIKKMFKDGNIVRISQKENKKSFTTSTVSQEEILEEISPRLFIRNAILKDQDYEKAKDHIRWLFNANAQKKEKPAGPEQEVTPTDNVVPIHQGWPKKDTDKEKMVKFFGDDWEEMRPSDEKVQALASFFDGAVYPNFTPFIEDSFRGRQRTVNLDEPPRIAA